MVLEICPNCRMRMSRQPYDTDAVHMCNSGRAVLDTESVPKTAETFRDFAGSPEETTGRNANPHLQGMANKLQGTVGGIEGEDSEEMNIHGKRASTYRRRQKYAYAEFRKVV